MQDIAKGEELTFDYNFERYGDKPMRCYCGSRNCRKSIGGTQQTYDESQLVGCVPALPSLPSTTQCATGPSCLLAVVYWISCKRQLMAQYVMGGDYMLHYLWSCSMACRWMLMM
jgi:hypothetical protein